MAASTSDHVPLKSGLPLTTRGGGAVPDQVRYRFDPIRNGLTLSGSYSLGNLEPGYRYSVASVEPGNRTYDPAAAATVAIETLDPACVLLPAINGLSITSAGLWASKSVNIISASQTGSLTIVIGSFTTDTVLDVILNREPAPLDMANKGVSTHTYLSS